MPASDRRLPLFDALLAGWALGSAVLVAEILQVAGARSLHLSGLGHGATLPYMGLLYGLAFAGVALVAWVITLPMRWVPGGRSGALLFLLALGAAPSVAYPLGIPTGGHRPGSFFGVPPWGCLAAAGLVWVAAALVGRRAEGARVSARLAWPFALVPFAASALVLSGGFALENAEGVPLDPRGDGFRVLQAAVVSLAGAAVARLAVRSRGPRTWLGAQAVLVVALGLGALLGRLPFAAAEERHPGPMALVIVIDTLRADALSMYGGPAEDTPQLARLREDAVLFERCVAPSPWTLPSFASLFTSTYPSEHLAGARFSSDDKGVRPIHGEVVTLAETLGEAGFRTVGSITNSNLERIRNLGRGFDRFSYGHSMVSYHPTSAWIVLRVLGEQDWYPMAELQTRWTLDELGLASRDPRPFLVIGHYTDPHSPYRAPARYHPPRDDAPALRRLYRAEVRYLDAALGELFDGLRTRGLYDDLFIVLTADHGEELDELRRGRRKLPDTGIHGHTLFQEQLHVPLLVKLPGQPLAGTVRSERVSLLDIAPTVLARLGVEVPPGFRGWDLFDAGNAGRYADRVVLAEAVMRREEQRAGFLGDVKVVIPDLPPNETLSQQFRLGSDPAELAPTALEGPEAEEVYRTLLAHLRYWSARFQSTREAEAGADDGEEPAELDPALLLHMKALGYTE